MVNHPDSSEESPDTVTDLRSHILAQQLRRVGVDCRHVPIELVVKSGQYHRNFTDLWTYRFVIQPGETVHDLRNDRCPSHDILHLSVRSQFVEILEYAHAKRKKSLCDLQPNGLVRRSRVEIQPQQDGDESGSTAGLLLQQVG